MSDRTVLQRSYNTERALSSPRPRFRGLSHRVAAAVTWPVGAVAVALTADPRARSAVISFVVGVGTMFTCSALLHWRPWDARTYERLFRLDHTGIYFAISGTGMAVALAGLQGNVARLLLTGALVGGGIGILLEWMPFAPPRGLSNTVYLTLGWLPVLLLPWLWSAAGPVPVVLLLLGGVLYTGGAIIVALRRPDPVPSTFGYHELFHALVIAAVVAHAAMVGVLVLGRG
jgi:hemolysin III